MLGGLKLFSIVNFRGLLILKLSIYFGIMFFIIIFNIIHVFNNYIIVVFIVRCYTFVNIPILL